MATIQEWLLKAEHDAMNAVAAEVKNRSDVEFIAMMADIDIFDDEENMEGMYDGE